MHWHDAAHTTSIFTTSQASGGSVTTVSNGFTDLRIYPPPSPSRRPTRGRGSGNQVVAGCRLCRLRHVLHVLHGEECNRLSLVSTPPRAPLLHVRGGCNGRLSLVSIPPRAPRAPRGGCNGHLSLVSIPPRAPRAPLEIPKMGVDPNLFALFAHLPSNHCVRTKIWLSTLVAWHETRSSNASTRRDAQRSRYQSVKPCRCTDRQETCDSGLRTGRNTRANPPG